MLLHWLLVTLFAVCTLFDVVSSISSSSSPPSFTSSPVPPSTTSSSSYTNSPVPTSYTRSPVQSSSTNSPSLTSSSSYTNTPVPTSYTNSPVPPSTTSSSSYTNSPVPTSYTNSPVQPSSTNSPVPPSLTSSSSYTNTPVPTSYTRLPVPSSTNSPVPPSFTSSSAPPSLTSSPADVPSIQLVTGCATSIRPSSVISACRPRSVLTIQGNSLFNATHPAIVSIANTSVSTDRYSCEITSSANSYIQCILPIIPDRYLGMEFAILVDVTGSLLFAPVSLRYFSPLDPQVASITGCVLNGTCASISTNTIAFHGSGFVRDQGMQPEVNFGRQRQYTCTTLSWTDELLSCTLPVILPADYHFPLPFFMHSYQTLLYNNSDWGEYSLGTVVLVMSSALSSSSSSSAPPVSFSSSGIRSSSTGSTATSSSTGSNAHSDDDDESNTSLLVALGIIIGLVIALLLSVCTFGIVHFVRRVKSRTHHGMTYEKYVTLFSTGEAHEPRMP